MEQTKNDTRGKMNSLKHFWNWKDGPDGRELYICGTIAADSWFDDDVTPEQFRAELIKGDGPITLWLNSYGGDCVAASRIYTMLLDYPSDVVVKIDGIGASAASVIAMAGTKVLMAPTACMIIHDPMTGAFGNTAEMEKTISMLETVKDSIIDAYEIKTGMDHRTISRLMQEETWMDSRKAIELGFADGMLEKKESFPVNDLAEPVLFSQKMIDAALVDKINPGRRAEPVQDCLLRTGNRTDDLMGAGKRFHQKNVGKSDISSDSNPQNKAVPALDYYRHRSPG